MRRLALLFFLSGAGALVVETTWMRWFRLLFGATAPAAAATLVAFFAGHALGAAAAARALPRVRRPLVVYGVLELVAVAAALLVPFALRLGELATASLYDALQGDLGALALLRFALALGATLPAAFCFGATLPAVGAAVVADPRGLGSTGSLFYGVNTLGAALGAALAAFFLPDWVGVPATYGLALGLSAAAGLGALALARSAPEAEADTGARSGAATGRGAEGGAAATAGGAVREAAAAREEAPRARAESRRARRAAERAPPPPTGAGWGSPRGLLALAAFSGFGSFALQVLLVHGFAQVLNQSVYAFGAVLVTVLLAMALGAAAVAWVERRERVDPRTLLGVALAATALGVAAFPALLSHATGGFAYLGSERPWPGYVFAALGTAAWTAGPALLAASLVFPLCFVLAARRAGFTSAPAPRHGAGVQLGRLVAANTLGALAGALAAPFVLLPLFGPWRSFALLALLFALPAVAFPDAREGRRWLRDGALALGWLAILRFASPLALPSVHLEPGERILAAQASAAGVVAVVERAGERLVRTDNYSVLGGTAEIVHQERQGHLPLLLHPHAKRVAYVGSATGISAGAVLAHPVEQLVLVEIVPGVAAAARDFFVDANRGVYDDPRTEVVLDDARNYLRATRARFDVVIADLLVPWRAGTGSLYTREHFEAVRRRLLPGGLFCQWLPLYQLTEQELRIVAATFLDVFPSSALFRGDFYGGFPIVALVGFEGDAASAAAISAAAQRLAAAGERDRWMTHALGPWSLYVGPLAALAPELRDAPRNSDAHPRIEFLAARSHGGGGVGKREAIVGLAWPRFGERLRAAARERGDDVFPDLDALARRTAEGGAALQAAGALYVAGRLEESAQAFAAASERLPAALVAAAPADPTAAEVWRDDPSEHDTLPPTPERGSTR